MQTKPSSNGHETARSSVHERVERIVRAGGIRLLAGRAVACFLRKFWQRERYIIYCLPSTTIKESTSPELKFIAINGLMREDDSQQLMKLAPLYESFIDAGDWGVIAIQNELPVGWAWIKAGSYVDMTGCGQVAIREGLQLLRYLEVLPEARGQGIGQAILNEATWRLSAVPHGQVIALVAETNIPSRKCFERVRWNVGGTITVRRYFWRRLITQLPPQIGEGHEIQIFY